MSGDEIEALRARLSSAEVEVRARAAEECLARDDPNLLVAMLSTLEGETDHRVIIPLVKAVGAFRDPQLVPKLRERLHQAARARGDDGPQVLDDAELLGAVSLLASDAGARVRTGVALYLIQRAPDRMDALVAEMAAAEPVWMREGAAHVAQVVRRVRQLEQGAARTTQKLQFRSAPLDRPSAKTMRLPVPGVPPRADAPSPSTLGQAAVVALPAVLVLLMGIAWSLRPPPPGAAAAASCARHPALEVKEVDGQAEVRTLAGAWTPLRSGDRLEDEACVRVSRDGQLTVSACAGARMVLGPLAHATLEAVPDGSSTPRVRVAVTRGALVSDARATPLILEARLPEGSVLGTTGPHQLRIEAVDRGARVEVRSGAPHLRSADARHDTALPAMTQLELRVNQPPGAPVPLAAGTSWN